ncbi:centrosomal protein of 126 kDa [Chanos chanos]|uniref:Centrosomal protein of 126 kDa n=1 Tax=Chanos chanos TaxID=29144 RepID=A0A6J2ULA4_CHACN|nr:centrosomal protein of 126 kDa [Chanos chanos]
MQVLQDSLFYSVRAGLSGELDDERELLVQEQKSCRARARKFSLETNRRRRALEERRRQRDIQEQRLRENILQQRRQRVQEATERFQRAHLPPSDRKRPGKTLRKQTPNIDEALSHIQGTAGSYPHQSFLSSPSTLSRSCTPSPRPPSGPTGSRCQRLSTAEAYGRLTQERSLSNLRSSQLLFLSELQESQSLLKDGEQSNPQEWGGTARSLTESLSSLDSLENEDPCQDQTTDPASCSSSCLDALQLQDSRTPQAPQKHLGSFWPSADINRHSNKSLLAKVLNHSSKPDCTTPKALLRDIESADSGWSLQDLTQAAGQCNLKDNSPSSNIQHHPNESNLLSQQALLSNLGHMTFCYDGNTQGNIQTDKSPGINHCETAPAVPDSTSLEFSGRLQEPKSNSEQEERCPKPPSAALNVLPRSTFKRTDGLCEVCSHSAVNLNVTSQCATVPLSSHSQLIETKSPQQAQKHKPDVDAAGNHGRETKTEWAEERCRKADSGSTVTNADLEKANVAKSSSITEQLARFPSQTDAAHPVSRTAEVRFLKGILKKQSKYIAGDTNLFFGPGHLIFTRQVAMSIRDSVELTKAKTKEPESSQTVKKKLRWFDEVSAEERRVDEDRPVREQNRPTPAKSRPGPQPPHKPVSVDHQQGSYHSAGHVSVPSGGPKNTSMMALVSPHPTKLAWADVEVQQQVEESKPHRASTRLGPRVPRRVRSARPGSGAVSVRARKGTIIRPQSASAASHVTKTQGKVMVPRPPPRTETVDIYQGDTPVHTTKVAHSDNNAHNKPGLSIEHTQYKDNSDVQVKVHRHVPKRDEGTLFAPVPPSYAYTCETMSKGIYALCQQDAPTVSAARRLLVCGENGLCLDRTPTDEEITQLWHGVRSALASKDGDPRSFPAHNSSLSVLPQARANLSHVTINGDTLISGVKAVTRMGGFFLSPPNVRSPIRRQVVETNSLKNRVCVDHNRTQHLGSGVRKLPFTYQAVTLIPGKADQTCQSEGPEIAEQFLRAEPHDEELVIDREDLIAVGTVQTHRAGVVQQQQRAQSLGLSALSLEEQRILQSLDKLNHRLQYVQEIVGANPALKGLFALDPACQNLSAQTGEAAAATRHRPHTLSANNHSRSHRRY